MDATIFTIFFTAFNKLMTVSSEYLSGYVLELILIALTTWLSWLRIIRPKLFFYLIAKFIEVVFKIQLTEIFAVSENAILERILNDNTANRVAFIDFRRNGTTEINILSEHRTVERSLKEINSIEAHQYRDLIDALTVETGAMIFNSDDTKQNKHKDFYHLLTTSYNCSSFVLIPIFQNKLRHHTVCVLICFGGHRIFDRKLLDNVKLQAGKVAKIAYLNSK